MVPAKRVHYRGRSGPSKESPLHWEVYDPSKESPLQREVYDPSKESPTEGGLVPAKRVSYRGRSLVPTMQCSFRQPSAINKSNGWAVRKARDRKGQYNAGN